MRPTIKKPAKGKTTQKNSCLPELSMPEADSGGKKNKGSMNIEPLIRKLAIFSGTDKFIF
ncbi:hypothetical protein A2303_04235 [Candidatus Falkowbacteria bacterium RIFOXYB2_FULL_47_14]|uniref:Uncharacterized protein n=1 Tax=Candidatus Falkowbacteria bacterium RIFOXYA2_FULL_47_19 TaxID=1797994 RepID=A0A1F5SK33_9BACT|nr:MAG: hypothetical protein A2227_04155 [Candidatus Falkowbacteria bacterium RIFOXYA2_FULL_47_19]OGF35380.1 MAG: hypothetical protein A2468_02325 [Candidatus Falkowbacteria bacterium RIFOXYC2_FULL_46_15]OGF43107.1 MAG: hypothetical protein A2303_04235 [Candidatus Falkowbacteria bacterium RIFOXYB2_FULL_47_14]